MESFFAKQFSSCFSCREKKMILFSKYVSSIPLHSVGQSFFVVPYFPIELHSDFCQRRNSNNSISLREHYHIVEDLVRHLWFLRRCRTLIKILFQKKQYLRDGDIYVLIILSPKTIQREKKMWECIVYKQYSPQ